MPKKPQPLPTHEYPDETPREYPDKPGYWIWGDERGFVYSRPISREERDKIDGGDWDELSGWRL